MMKAQLIKLQRISTLTVTGLGTFFFDTLAKNLAAFGLYSESLSGAKFEADILSCLVGENSKRLKGSCN